MNLGIQLLQCSCLLRTLFSIISHHRISLIWPPSLALYTRTRRVFMASTLNKGWLAASGWATHPNTRRTIKDLLVGMGLLYHY